MKKYISLFLSAISILACAGFTACTTDKKQETTLPIAYEKENFSFALTWNTYGISSYDSQTGALIKTKDAPNPDDFSATCILTDEELVQIYETLVLLNLDSYPDEYIVSEYGSDPSVTLILTARNGDKVKTITAKEVPIGGTEIAKDEKAADFLEACSLIQKILEDTDVWKAFPDYPYLYD